MQKRLAWLMKNNYVNLNGNIEYTKTTRFLLPLIGISEYSLKFINKELLINTHIKSPDEFLIFLILNSFDFPEEVKNYLSIQQLNENYIDHIIEVEEVIIIYKIPDYFIKDYNKILQNKYSKTTKEYKSIITQVYSNHRELISHLPSVYDCIEPTYNKRKLLADRLGVDVEMINEVSSRPDLDYEVYKPINELDE